MMGGLGSIGKVPELKQRVLFTLLMLAIYRLGVFVSTPGIDVKALRSLFEANSGTIFDLVNMFSGGSLENFSIFTLGIMPYISVSIIMQFLTPVVPALAALKKEGAAGQRVLTRYTRIFTVALAIFQSYVIATGLESQGLVLNPGMEFKVLTVCTLTAGTAFIMWLGEQITERGIGNGMSMIIFAGIIARMPSVFVQTLQLAQTGEVQPHEILLVLIFCAFTIVGIVYVERCFRKVPVQYPRRMVGKNIAQAQTQYLPLKLNMAGVIPPIFASAFLVLPATITQFSGSQVLKDYMAWFQSDSLVYNLIFVALIIVFSYYYTAVVYDPNEVAENLKKGGGFVPTVRPGKPTADYLYGILNRLTFWGSIYIAIVCVVPQLVYAEVGMASFGYIFGGTAVLIAVSVTLDTASQIESYVLSHNYEAFLNKAQKAGRSSVTLRQARARMLKR